MMFEELDGSLVLFRGSAAFESAKIPSLTRAGILFAGIQPVSTRLQSSDHCDLRFLP
jgi:hypothetical protein